MKRWVDWILFWYERFLEFIGKRPTAYRVVFTEEVPDIVEPRRLYAIGENSPWLAVVSCPCGCGEVIHLSLLDADSPHWQLKIDRTGKPTVSPSIWRTKGCEAHFFLKAGVVRWCGDV
jgi:hypothetical protein